MFVLTKKSVKSICFLSLITFSNEMIITNSSDAILSFSAKAAHNRAPSAWIRQPTVQDSLLFFDLKTFLRWLKRPILYVGPNDAI